jgi:hypothetical protein
MTGKRIALVLVPGVGEEGAGETATAVTRGLTRAGLGYRSGDRGTIGIEVRGGGARGGELHEAETRSLVRRHDGVDHRVDLVEMRWSDLSSFPRGLIAFFISFFGLALQLSTVGLEAVQGMLRRAGRRRRGLGAAWRAVVIASLAAGLAAALLAILVAGWSPPAGVLLGIAVGGAGLLAAVVVDRGRDYASIARTLAEAASWLAAAVIVPLTLVTALVTAAFWLMVDEWLSLPDVAIAWVALIGGAVLVMLLAQGIKEGGWHYGGGGWMRVLDPRLWAFAMLAGVVVAMAVRLAQGRSVLVATADTLAGVAAFGLRGAWMLGVGVVGLALILLAASFLAERRASLPAARRLDPRGLVTGTLATALSPFLVALVGLILFSGISAVAFDSAKDARWGSDAPDVLCLADASSWTLGDRCGAHPATWPAVSQAIRVLSERAERSGVTAQKAESYTVSPLVADRPRAAVRATDAVAEAELAERRAVDLEDEAGTTPVDWARALYTATVTPFANAIVACGLLLLVFLLLVAWWALRSSRWWGGVDGRRQGRAILRAQRAAMHPAAAVAVVVVALICAYWTWTTWTGRGWRPEVPGLIDTSPDIWEADSLQLLLGGSATLVLFTVLGRVLPVDFRKPLRSVGGSLEAVRKRIDIPYDVATYLRIDRSTGVRTRILARYRALLAELSRRDYDAIVLVAHSQGTALSAAVLMGDRYRRDFEAVLAGAGYGVTPSPRPPAPLTGLLTFGCPLRLLYDQRLPTEYEALWARAGHGGPTTEQRMRALTMGWVNVYRARDYIGRSVFIDPQEDAALVQGRIHAPDEELPGGRDFLDVCLRGTKAHTGYWGDREHTAWIDYMVRRALGEPRGWYPRGYRPGP